MPKIYSAGNTLPAADLNGIVQVAGGYAASSTGNDTYVITVTPVPGSLTAGDIFYFKADVPNTGAASLNVNSLGAKTIKKWNGTSKVDLSDNNIVAGQTVAVCYDGTDFILLGDPQLVYKNGISSHDLSITGTQTIAHGLGAIPKYIRIVARVSTGSTQQSISDGVYNGTTVSCVHIEMGANNAGTDNANIISVSNGVGGWTATATISVDATNITLTWSKTGTPTVTLYLVWEAQV